jgi:hypothetical protein
LKQELKLVSVSGLDSMGGSKAKYITVLIYCSCIYGTNCQQNYLSTLSVSVNIFLLNWSMSFDWPCVSYTDFTYNRWNNQLHVHAISF